MANMLNSSMLKVFSILNTPFPQINKKEVKKEFLRLKPKVQIYKQLLIQNSPTLNESFIKFQNIIFGQKRILMFN